MVPVYGLTGGIACGKSAVGEIFTRHGAHVIDADALARAVVAPGSPALAEIRDVFGEGVIRSTGELDRAALGAIVFRDERARQRLEAITHPRISEASLLAIANAQAGTAQPIFYDAALLVERGRHRDFAALVVVTCSPATQRARLIARDALSPEDAAARIGAQAPLAEKEALADYLIQNDGSLADLEARSVEVLSALREGAR